MSHLAGLRARGWGWRWNGRRAWAVRGLDLDVAPGERVLLLGPSGAGKSTLLAGVAGLLDAGTGRTDATGGTGESEGELLLDGVPAARARTSAVASGTGRARTGLLLQDPQAQTVLSRCGDDVAFGLENHAVAPDAIWPRVEAALADVDLPVPRDRPTAALSGGQRQRLALAGVLALRPGLLLLDEPTAMLDPGGAARLRRVVAEALATGTGCLLVEHGLDLWWDLADRVVVLAPGAGVLADGAPARVLAERGDDLAAAGVWLPGRVPTRRGAAGAAARPDAAPSRPAGAPGCAGRPAPRSGDPLLVLEGVAVGRRGSPAVLTGLDAVVRAGRAVVLRGPNGAGKSTLALVLAGLTAPVAGRVRALPALARGAGEDPLRWRSRELVARTGSVFQDPRHQFVAATVTEELAVGPRRLGLPGAEVDARTAELLERLRLAPLARANPFTLSGGQQRRLSVATALATRPALLVLDEPTFGQDAATWAELVDLLAEQRDGGAALVVATHDDALTEALGDTTWSVGDGRVQVPAEDALPDGAPPDGAFPGAA